MSRTLGQLLLCELVDLVRAKARPRVVGCDNDGGLDEAKALDLVERGRILAHVNHLVLDALLVEGAVRGFALHTGRLGVYRDCHDDLPSVRWDV